MRILIAINDVKQAKELLTPFHFDGRLENNKATFNYKQKEVHLIITGYTQYETAFRMAEALTGQAFHLVLQLGLSGTLDSNLALGSIVNVVREKPGFLGKGTEKGIVSAYGMKWLDNKERPHVKGGYSNFTNSYFNVFLPFSKVLGITYHTLEGTQSEEYAKQEHYPNSVESTNGLSFQYACLMKGIPFYQIRAISYHLLTSQRNEALASDMLSKAIKFILNKL